MELGVRHALWQEAEEVANTHGRLQHGPRLVVHVLHRLIDSLDNGGAGIVGVDRGSPGGGVFLRGQQLVQFGVFPGPFLVVGVKRLGKTAPAHIAGENFLFLRRSKAALRLDLLQGTDSRHIVLIFGFVAAYAQVIIGDVKIVLFRAEVHFLKDNLKSPCVHAPHHFGSDGCRRRSELAAVQFYTLRLRGKVMFQPDKLVKVQGRQFIVDQFPQAVIAALLHAYIVHKLADAEIQQIDLHLDFVLLILGGGIGDTDMLRVGEVHFLNLVLISAKVADKLLCGFQIVSLGAVLFLQ